MHSRRCSRRPAKLAWNACATYYPFLRALQGLCCVGIASHALGGEEEGQGARGAEQRQEGQGEGGQAGQEEEERLHAG